MTVARQRFLGYVQLGGRILDAGCGSGRDTKAFAEQGYRVEAFDASIEMARMASKHAGRPVRQLTFQQMCWIEEFDGIWASASLLHVPRVELHKILGRLGRALKIAGVLYVSFKHGTFDREKDGRHFTDMTEDLLRHEVRQLPELQCLEMWVSEDVRPDRPGELWVNALVKRRRSE